MTIRIHVCAGHANHAHGRWVFAVDDSPGQWPAPDRSQCVEFSEGSCTSELPSTSRRRVVRRTGACHTSGSRCHTLQSAATAAPPLALGRCPSVSFSGGRVGREGGLQPRKALARRGRVAGREREGPPPRLGPAATFPTWRNVSDLGPRAGVSIRRRPREGRFIDLERIGFWARLWLCFILPWRMLFNGALAARVASAARGAARPGEVEDPGARDVPQQTPGLDEIQSQPSDSGADQTAALQLLAILQREGRLIDFLQDEVTAYSDAEIGAAARVVHEGCKRGLAEFVEIEPVRASESEGESLTLEPGFDAAKIRVTGNVAGKPPYSGTLAHHGWQVTRIRLPELVEGHDARILAPAEVEIS